MGIRPAALASLTDAHRPCKCYHFALRSVSIKKRLATLCGLSVYDPENQTCLGLKTTTVNLGECGPSVYDPQNQTPAGWLGGRALARGPR